MIGRESLWDNLVLYKSPPTLNSDFYNLFTLAKESPLHITSFNSKLFLSAIISDETYSRHVRSISAQIWLKAHGFSSPIAITLERYLTAVIEFGLLAYFQTELKYVPSLIYTELLTRLVQAVQSNVQLLEIYPCVLEVELVKCKTGVSKTENLGVHWEFLTRQIHRLPAEVTDRLVMLTTSLFHLLMYQGPGTVRVSLEKFCKVSPHLPQDDISFLSDDAVLECLHTQSGAACCKFKTYQNLGSQFQHLHSAYEGANMFLDSLMVEATVQNQPHHLDTVYSFAVYIVSDLVMKGLYSPPHISYLQNLIRSIPGDHVKLLKSSPLYKTYNFDPASALWSDLHQQVQNDLSKAKQSFEVMMTKCELDDAKIKDCIGLISVLCESQLAALFAKVLSNNEHCVSGDSITDVITNLIHHFKPMSAVYLSNFCKYLYDGLTFDYLLIANIPEFSNITLLDNTGNITKTINQLGSKGTLKLRESLYHKVILNFILAPGTIIREIVSQAARNKALVVPISDLIRDLLPFTLKTTCPISKVAFDALRREFDLLKTIKDVKQFDDFTAALSPTLSHESMLRHILMRLPIKKKCQHHLILHLLRTYIQRVPFYNFSLFYHIVHIWSTSTDETCVALIDDSIIVDTMMEQLKLRSLESEGEVLFNLLKETFGWCAAVRFGDLLGETKLPLPIIWNDMTDIITSDHFVFKGDDLHGGQSVISCVIKLATLSSRPFKFHLQDSSSISEEFFEEFVKSEIRSAYEWRNISRFLVEVLGTTIMLGVSSDGLLGKVYSDVVGVMENIDPKFYLTNDMLTFTMLSIVAGNTSCIRWFGKLCNQESEPYVIPRLRVTTPDNAGTAMEESACVKRRCFVLCCVMVNFNQASQSLDTLVLSLSSNVRPHPHVDMAMEMLPSNIQGTLKKQRDVVIAKDNA